MIASLFKTKTDNNQSFEKLANEIYDGKNFYTEISKESIPYKYKEFYKSDVRKVNGYLSSYSPLIKNGIFRYYSPEGKLYLEGNFIHNKKVGEWKAYNPDGRMVELSNFQNDKLEGDRLVYFEDGAYSKEKFVNDSSICLECVSKNGVKVNCDNFDKDAVFRNNSSNMEAYIQENIDYPDAAIDNGFEGKVYVQFQINKYGFVENIKVLRSANILLDKSALLLMNNVPNWFPAISNGKLINTGFVIPINFKLE